MTTMYIRVKNHCSECGAACGGRKTCSKKCAAQRWVKRQKELPSQQYIKVQKKCLHCGAPSGRRLTCSKECEKQRREAQRVLRESRCLECSTVLLSKAGNRKFCGKECYLTNKRRNAEPIQLRFYSCTYCKKRFGRPGNRPYNYCSHACRNLDDRKQHTCKRCSKTFPHKRGGGKHMFCSRACSDRLLRFYRFADARKRGVNIKRMTAYRMRLLLPKREQYEKFKRTEVFERDGWRCNHCKKRTRPDYDRNHELYPHLDHIVPVSRGGLHVKANVQLLCRACNLKKGNKLLSEQLLLIG